MVPRKTELFIRDLKVLLDEDLGRVLDEQDVSTMLIVLVQILREMKQKPDEEASPRVPGFTGRPD